jgi:peptidoglycan/LPS O-acetylase OafA/YrhL
VGRTSQGEKFGGLLDPYKFSTIAEKYASASFRPTGFDYLRVTLAVAIAFWHAFLYVHGATWSNAVLETQWRLPIQFLVPSFFALSGFLIAGSLERSTIPVFVGLRILRIVPALAVDTLITIFLIGPFFTVLPLREYFFNKVTWKYLMNIIGHIHYRLPGVFLYNPLPEIINAQLWTIPWELACYVSIVILAIVGLTRSRTWFLVFAIIIPISVLAILTTISPERFGRGEAGFGPHSIELVLCFLTGFAIYKYRDTLPHSAAMAVLAVAGYGILMNTEYAAVFTSLLVAYITIWVGVINYPKTFVIRVGDYSYGIYLYHSTVQQALISLGLLTWYSVFGVGLVLVTGVAAMSWNLVEKPALSLRRFLKGKSNPQQTQSAAVAPDLKVRTSALPRKPSPRASSSA